VGYDGILPTCHRILLPSVLIQEDSNFHSCYQSRLPTNAALRMLNIKLYDIFGHCQLRLQEETYDRKKKGYETFHFYMFYMA
jgi:hypothetical protein